MADMENPFVARRRKIENVVDAASAPTASASAPAKKSGIDFFRSKPATPAQKSAKQAALVKKLRTHEASEPDAD